MGSTNTEQAISLQTHAAARQERQERQERWRARCETALIVIGLAALLLFLGHHVYSDAEVRYQELSALLLHGDLSHSKFSLIGPLFSTPRWLQGASHHEPIHEAHRTPPTRHRLRPPRPG